MRISTQGFQTQWLDDIYARQTEVARVQKQVSTGRSFNTAAENPSGASQSITLQQGIDRIANYAANAEAAQRRLGLEENALATVGDSLTRLRELAVEAGNGNLPQESRDAIASEAGQILQALVATANSQDGEGRYLFAGNRTTTAPFVQGSAGVQYNGDQGARVQRIGENRTVQENDPGSGVFLAIPSGNGTFSVAANPANTGAAFYATASVASLPAWVPGNYTINFSGPAA
jgi:flagellar hook-associated protein 3 FlgL